VKPHISLLKYYSSLIKTCKKSVLEVADMTYCHANCPNDCFYIGAYLV